MNHTIFAENLKKFRTAQNLTQEQVAASAQGERTRSFEQALAGAYTTKAAQAINLQGFCFS